MSDQDDDVDKFMMMNGEKKKKKNVCLPRLTNVQSTMNARNI